MMKKGEIWLLDFPSKGKREQSGMRPAIIIGDSGIGMIVAVPLTSNLQAKRFPFTLEIKKSPKNNLDKDSVILIFQIQSLDKNRFISRIGGIEQTSIIKVDKIITDLLKI